MNYIYDIYLNFNKDLYDFFDWNKSDKLIHIKTIPIFRITEENIKDLINYDIKIDEKYLKNILNKSITLNKTNNYKNYILFCDSNNIIAIEFDNQGKSINKSTLLITEELEILEIIHKFKIKHIEYSILNKSKVFLKTRKQMKDENFINDELLNMDIDKLKYLYFECFSKQEVNKKKIVKKLLSLSKNSKTYKNLYNIVKLTSTTNK